MTTILNELILFSITPVGFIISMTLLIFSEYIIAKSIIQDTGTVRIKKIFNNILDYSPGFKPLACLRSKAFAVIPKEKKADMREVSGVRGIMAVNYIKINEWFSR